ncbi:SDR family NAD(P)-dependent oxidoreductase [Nocardia testacea]|uniref:SDR family NAD(P)-dependent oxidoreductase n=1 Tax=Nocardia testacea TaxID=248551 RepID=A0ABW7VYK9_9NOCA
MWSVADIPDQRGRRVLVTGATSGLGRYAALLLARAGAAVTLAGRDEQRLAATAAEFAADSGVRTAAGTVETLLVDLSALDSVRRAGDEFQDRHGRLDVLLNAAGMQSFRYARSADGIEQHLATNYVGTFAFTGALLPVLAATPGARITTVTSMVYKWGDPGDLAAWFDAAPEPGPGNAPSRRFRHRFAYSKLAYSNSKLAVTLFAVELDRRLRAAGLSASATVAHPGTTFTGLLREWPAPVARLYMGTARLARAAHPIEQGVLPLLRAATAPEADSSMIHAPAGPIREQAGPPATFPFAGNIAEAIAEGAAQRLWELTEDRIGYAVPIPSSLGR